VPRQRPNGRRRRGAVKEVLVRSINRARRAASIANRTNATPPRRMTPSQGWEPALTGDTSHLL